MRTDVDKVRAILTDSDLTDDQITGYITAANVFTTNAVSGKGLQECVLEEIERWITAHMVSTTSERVAQKEGAGGAFIEYAGQFGEGLKSTSYGQMAILMDTSGTLAKLSGKAAWIRTVNN